MMIRIGKKFKPTFHGSGIDHFEVIQVDEKWVHTKVYPKEGECYPFEDKIEKDICESALNIGEYVYI